MASTNENGNFLGPLLTDPSRIRREAVRRRKLFDEKSVAADAIPDHEAEGWQVDRKLKRVTKVKREKEIDERLENRLWMLLFRLGYPEISDGRNFTVRIERKGAEPLRKQVDVFGKDEETVVVVECKASEKLTRRSLQKDIEEFANLKGPISNAIRKHYGPNYMLDTARPSIIRFANSAQRTPLREQCGFFILIARASTVFIGSILEMSLTSLWGLKASWNIRQVTLRV